MVRRAGGESREPGVRGRGGAERTVSQQRGQRDCAEARAGLKEHLATSEVVGWEHICCRTSVSLVLSKRDACSTLIDVQKLVRIQQDVAQVGQGVVALGRIGLQEL